MAGRSEGCSDLAWSLFVDRFPPPRPRGRAMPPTPFRNVVYTLLYGLITGCRWCDLPCGPPWASKSATPRWLQRWQPEGTLAAMQARRLGSAEERSIVQWQYGAVDGAFSPGQGRQCGGRTRRQGPGHPHPHAHGCGGHAGCQLDAPCQWGDGPRSCRCGRRARSARVAQADRGNGARFG
jgi:hypothetical protein